MLNMPELTPQHPNDETVEQYCMRQMSGAELEHFRLHMLLCLRCQYRVCERTNTCPASAACELCRPRPQRGRSAFMRNVFVSHGGPSFAHVRAVRDFLDALDFVPVIVQQLLSSAVSVEVANQSKYRARGRHASDDSMYLKEAGVRFPSNFAEKVWIEFTGTCSGCIHSAHYRVASVRALTEHAVSMMAKTGALHWLSA